MIAMRSRGALRLQMREAKARLPDATARSTSNWVPALMEAAAVREELQEKVDETAARAKHAPYPDIEEIRRYVYAG